MKTLSEVQLERLRRGIEKALAPLKKSIRKSSDSPDGSTRKDGYISIAKYIRGGYYGIWQDAEPEKELYEEAGVLSKTASLLATSGTGSFLVHPQISGELIGLLEAKAIVRTMGATIYPMSSDTLWMDRQTAGATGAWIGENEQKTTSDTHAFGRFELVLKEYAAIVKISSNLLKDASRAVDTIVKRDLVKKLQLAEDLAFLEGTGGKQPMGIYRDPNVTHTTLSATPTYDDLMDAMYAIEAANGTYSGWVAHPRTKNTLRQIKDANGNYIWRMGGIGVNQGQQVAIDTLLGLPIRYTTQIPITNRPSAGQSYMILGNWSEFAIGQKEGIDLAASDQAGTAFEYDEVWLRAINRVDCGIRQPAEFIVIDGIQA